MLRARLAHLLDDQLIKRLEDASDLEDALMILRGTPYGILETLYRQSGDLKTGEVELFAQEIRILGDLDRYVDLEVLEMVRALSLNYEIENLKNALRLFFDHVIRGRTIEHGLAYLYAGRIASEIDVRKVAQAGSFEEVIGLLKNSPYGHIVERCVDSIQDEQSLFTLEGSLDRYYYENLMDTAARLHKRDREVALRLIGIEIDLLNINWIIRLRYSFKQSLDKAMSNIIPHGFLVDYANLRDSGLDERMMDIIRGIIERRYPSLAALFSAQVPDRISRLLLIERILHQILMLEVRRILSGYPFTIGILLAYFIMKRQEIRRIRAVLNAKQYKLSKERMRETL
jgi:V/A-type H+-transporting ATPase subunit C